MECTFPESHGFFLVVVVQALDGPAESHPRMSGDGGPANR